MSKGILGIGDSFMWGEGLYYYSELPNLPFNEKHKFDYDSITEGYVGYKNKHRFIQLVANHYNTWCTTKDMNGSTNEYNLEFLNLFNYTDIVEPNGKHHFSFRLNINEYKLVIFLFTSHLRDNSIHNISDMLKAADKTFNRFEEKGITVCTLCWMPEFFNNDTYNELYVKKNRHTEIEHKKKVYNWYEDLCEDDSNKLTIKSDFSKDGLQTNDTHFNQRGNLMIADSIIRKLNQNNFKISNI